MRELSLNSQDLVILAQAVLGQGKTLRFRAIGMSMHPFIRDGEVIEVHPIGDNSIKRGDIVLYHNEHKRVFAHRVIRIIFDGQSEQYETKGDALLRSDGLIPRQHVLGCVTSVERDGHQIKLIGDVQRFSGLFWGRLHFFLIRACNVVASLKRLTLIPKRSSNIKQ